MNAKLFDNAWSEELAKKDKRELVEMIKRVINEKEKLAKRVSDHAFMRVLSGLKSRGLITEDALLIGIATLEAGL